MNPIYNIISLLTPYDCLFCDREGALVCNNCRLEIIDSIPSRCFLCKSATNNYDTCSKCRKMTPLKRVYVSTTYNENIKRLIHKMKLASAREATSVIAKCLDELAPYFDNLIVCYVPTAPAHVRLRGFNHTRLIAKEFAQIRGYKTLELLSRTDSAKQVGRTRQERLSQLKGVFAIEEKPKPKQTVLLIDDVTTTGATINEAAKTLKKSGIKNVEALIFAQTI
jgi:ComF family protein